MYAEADFLPISGLQHMVFCERQCALIHVERQWEENRLTAQGRLLHKRVDSAEEDVRGGVRILRGVVLRSPRLGLVGRADVVELHPCEPAVESLSGLPRAVRLAGLRGFWSPVPIEYKRGRPKRDDSDRVQLCAQAICLEETLGVAVPLGKLFYGKRRRRLEVAFEAELRSRVEELAARFHEMVDSGRTPIAYREPKCRQCSLLEVCLPPPVAGKRTVAVYLENELWKPLQMERDP